MAMIKIEDKIIYHGDFIITLHGDGTFTVKTKK
jgi:hypothetical protein